ncbi:nuclear transcription factor Y subunit B-6 [Rosa sericea]
MEQGGFHGYQKTQNKSSGLKLSEINMRLAEINHTKNKAAITNNGTAATTDENECTVREQDRFMPIANVIRIMRKILPPHAKISDDAKETIQECVSEYISFITGEANERCQREQRKTITAEDVLWAMSKLGFDDYIEPLTLYLHRFREMEGDRGSMRAETLMKTSSRAMTAAEYHAAAAGSFAGFAPFHHQYGFFGYLKDASISNGAAGTSLSQQANAVAAMANGDHQASHSQYHDNNK